MNKEFKITKGKSQTVYTLESASSGGTSSGSVASVSSPMGGVRKRGDNLIAREASKDKVPASTPRNFVAKNAKTSGAGAHKDKKKEQKQGTVKHKKPYMESLKERLAELKEKLEEGYGVVAENAKWRQGYSASGHPAGYKHKSGEVGPVGGTFTNEPSGYDGETSKVPVQKHRDQPDQLASRGDTKVSTSGKPLLPRNAQKNLKHAIQQSKGKHGPVGDLPEGYQVVPGIDKERYQERPGLEGPFHTKSGKVVYYDKREGKYYDPDSDYYISHDDWQAMNQGVAEGSGGNWYIRVNGKILNDTKFKPVIFSSKDEARSHAMKLADKKRIPLSQIKLTKSWMDAPEPGVAEGAPELLKKEMPTHRHAEKLLAQNGVSKDDPDYHHHLGNTIKYLRQFGNIDLINKQGVAEGSTTRGGFGGSASQAQHEIQWLKNKIETLKPLLAKKPSVARQIKDLERQIRERELAIAYQKEGVAEGSLNEFAPSDGGGDSGNYFQALASAWYNGTFDSGSLEKGIKSQEDVERLLQRGIVCPDGVTRKFDIGYNSNFDGVVISSDDYYEHADHDETDSRTGKPFGPYDYMEFGGEELDESAKWRDPKFKDQLYTQEKPDYNDTREYDRARWDPKPKGYKGRKEPLAGGEFPRTDPLVKGFGRYGVGEPVSKGPRKGLPSRDQITSLKGSIKDAHGKHHKPNLPEQGVAEGSEEIDTKGRSRQEWTKQIHAKHPDARVIHSEDGTSYAILPDGRKVRWIKDEADFNEGISDTIKRGVKSVKRGMQGVAEASTNDYFKRRKDEEDRIAGKKAPAKRTPRQTDYEKKRKEQGVAEGAKVDRQASHITKSMMKKGKSKKDAESIAWAHIKHPKNESVDPYFESLTNKLNELKKKK